MALEKLAKVKNKETQHKQAAKIISTPSAYKPGETKPEEGWSATELAAAECDSANVAMKNILAGRGEDGASPAPEGAGGFDGMVRLKVLTRQACVCDKEGTPINNGNGMGMDPFFDGAKDDEEPQVGDIVIWKGDLREGFLKKTPHEIARFEREHEHEPFPWREGMRHYYKDFHVDADGCISVKPHIAVEMLTRRGEKITFPKFAAQTNAAQGKTQRKITNWWFREVPQDYKKQQNQNNQHGQNNGSKR